MNKQMYFIVRLIIGLQLAFLGIITIITGQADTAFYYSNASETVIIFLGIGQLLSGLGIVAILSTKKLPFAIWAVLATIWVVVLFGSSIFAVDFSNLNVYEWLVWLNQLAINIIYTVVIFSLLPKKKKN